MGYFYESSSSEFFKKGCFLLGLLLLIYVLELTLFHAWRFFLRRLLNCTVYV